MNVVFQEKPCSDFKWFAHDEKYKYETRFYFLQLNIVVFYKKTSTILKRIIFILSGEFLLILAEMSRCLNFSNTF